MKIFQQIIDIARGKDPLLQDFIWSMIISNKYIIVPIGTFCLPRVITTLCHLKKRRLYGEKSYPFDLAFFNDINMNISLIDNHFKNFYDDLEFDSYNHNYINSKLKCVFNHDGKLTPEEFKKCYDKRIKNFYNDISKENKTIYFILASFKILEKEQINNLINTIKKIRHDNFKIILLYCNTINTIDYNSNYIAVIDNIDLRSINDNKGWTNSLRKQNNKQSKKVYNYMSKKLKEIIK